MKRASQKNETTFYSLINFINTSIIVVVEIVSLFPIFETNHWDGPSYNLWFLDNVKSIDGLQTNVHIVLVILSFLIFISLIYAGVSKKPAVFKNKVIYKACQFGFPIETYFFYCIYHQTRENGFIIHFGVYIILVLFFIGSILPYTPLRKTRFLPLTFEEILHFLSLDNLFKDYLKRNKDELLEDSEKTEPLLGNNSVQSSLKVCSVCNSPVDTDAQFCPHCGSKLNN